MKIRPIKVNGIIYKRSVGTFERRGEKFYTLEGVKNLENGMVKSVFLTISKVDLRRKQKEYETGKTQPKPVKQDPFIQELERDLLALEQTEREKANEIVNVYDEDVVEKKALGGRVKGFNLKKLINNLRDFDSVRRTIMNPATNYIKRRIGNGVKLTITHSAIFRLVKQTGKLNLDVMKSEKDRTFYFQSVSKKRNIPPVIILQGTTSKDIRKILNNLNDEIQRKIDEFTSNGSDYIYQFSKDYYINLVSYNPINAKKYIPLPKFIETKKAVLNIQNDDNYCFLWCVLAHIHPVESKNHPNRVNKYAPYFNELNIKGLEFPMNIDNISKFEKMNNVSINVYYSDKKNNILPLRITKDISREPINLFYWSDKEGNTHYGLIKNFSRLVSSQIDNKKNEKHVCYRCLCSFNSDERLKKHVKDACVNFDPAKLEFPKEDHIEFKNYNRSLKVPFVIYSDCESNLVTKNEQRGDKTSIYQEHIPYSFSYYIVSEFSKEFFDLHPELKGIKIIKNKDDVVDEFIRTLKSIEKKISEFLESNIPMNLSNDEEKRFQDSNVCHICEKNIEGVKVRDHCHITGKFRGSACFDCNINYNYKNVKIPIIFHNLKKYDGHFIFPKLGDHSKAVSAIAKTIEEYVSFSSDRLRFVDSYAFLSASIEKLSNNLSKDQFKHLEMEFKDNEHIDLLKRKGIYPYDYMKNNNVYNESKLPTIEHFYNKLNDEKISENDYKHALNVFTKFNCQSIGDYHDLYLKCDVLLLADIFETFRNNSLTNYKLDPCYYLTSPGLAWDACLRLSECKLELIKDPDMFMMIESGIRGGISIITKRHSKANNKYLPEFDKNKESKYIMYFDANNLYGWAMSCLLPYDNFKFDKEPEKWTPEMIKCLGDNSPQGAIFEVDLEYPIELHDKHRYYPLAPEKMKIDDTMLSQYALETREKLGLSKSNVQKLVPNLYDKTRYVVHYRVLKFYLEQGLKLKKVHRVITFNQKAWMKEFINFNTNKRKQAQSEFEKDFYKLMNNSCFGKTMENVRNRIDVKFVTTQQKLEKLTKKPTYNDCKIFHENLVAVHMNKTNILLDKPIVNGFSILDLSKLLMYDFYYNVLVKKYGDKVRLLMTDTDSVLFEVQTDDFYNDMNDFKQDLDLSEYPKEHAMYDDSNKKVIGKFKDETGSKPISEFIGLRSKMYSYTVGNKESKRGKGIKKAFVDKNIRFENYKRCLFGETIEHTKQEATFNLIRSKDHKLYSQTIRKNGLVSFDDKTHLIDAVECIAHGHYSIRKN